MHVAKILVPLLSANEIEAIVVDLCVRDGQWVDSDSPICVLETTKTTLEVAATEAGYVRQLAVSVGDSVAVGDLICFVADSPDEPVEEALSALAVGRVAVNPLPPGLRITKPALRLAQELGVDLSQFPGARSGIVTEAMIRKTAGPEGRDRILRVQPCFDNRIVVYGGGGHGKSVIDLIRQTRAYRILGIADDALSRETVVLGIPVLGSRRVLPELVENGVRLAANALGGISSITARVEVSHVLAELGFAFPVLLHPRSVVEPSAHLEDGVQVFANAYVGSEVMLKQGCIINTGAVVSHDSVVGQFSHIAPGALLAGGVQVGARTLVGMGVTTAIGVRIGSDVRIGNGALVHQDVPDGTIIVAGTNWNGGG